MIGGESLAVNGRRQRAAFISRCFPTTVDIPVELRHLPLDAFRDVENVVLTETLGTVGISQRLADTLRKAGVRFLSDLHGRNVRDFASKKNCSFGTLHELDSLARCLSRGYSSLTGLNRNIETSPQEDRRCKNILSRGIPFAIPESVSRLRFDELPMTTRLANFLRFIKASTLGDLNGCTARELLKCEACGWRTVAEIQQLIECAIDGEFDEARVEEPTAPAELTYVVEQAIAKLPPHQGEFVLARIEGMTFAEIGRRYGLTRARIHQVFEKALETVKKTYGPRIPRLLELVKRRCLSIPNGSPLTAALLEQWTQTETVEAGVSPAPTKRFRLSREAQLRLIMALDKTIPCYVDSALKPGSDELAVASPSRRTAGGLDLTGLARALRLASAPENPPISGTSVSEPSRLPNDRYHQQYDHNRVSMLPRQSL
jgi:hypothetical protein